METVAELSQYRLSFVRMAKWLKKRGHVTESELAKEFLRGLPRSIQTRLADRETIRNETRAHSDLSDDGSDDGSVASGRLRPRSSPTYQELYEEVRSLLDDDDNYFSNTLREFDREKDDPPRRINREKKNEAKEIQPLSTKLQVAPSTANTSELEQLTRQMNELRILVTSLATQPKPAPPGPSPSAPAHGAPTRDPPPHFVSGGNNIPLGTTQGANGYRTQAAGGGGFVPGPPQAPCPVCRGPAPFHYKGQCPELRQYLDQGIARMDAITRKVLFPDGTDVPSHPQGMKVPILERAEREKQPKEATHAARPVRLDWYPPEVSNGPKQFMAASAGEIQQYEVDMAEKRRREEGDEGDQERPREKRKVGVPYVEIPVRRAPPREAPRGPAPVNTPRAARFEEHTGGDVRMADNEPAAVAPEDKENTNGEAPTRKAPASRPWSKVIARYEEEANQIPSAILDSKLSLSVGSVLALSNDLAKTMSEEFKVKRVPIPTTTWKSSLGQMGGVSCNLLDEDDAPPKNTEGSAQIRTRFQEYDGPSEVREEQHRANAATFLRKTPVFCGAVGKIYMQLQGIEVAALFDTGSEINLCPRRIYVKTGMPLQEGRLFLTDANSNSTRLLGSMENAELSCGPMRVKQHVYVQKDSSYDVLLGMPFISSVSTRTWFDGDGSLWCKMVDHDDNEVTVCMTRPDARDMSLLARVVCDPGP
ncbi:hypothetical protein JCM10213_008535 [Rhodosporidiobolus nylandii]